MTSKLLRKLQTTTRKITDEFGTLCGRQDVCRASVLFAAALATGFASGADNWVRSTDYQQNSTGGNVPLVRIETTAVETDSQVVQVSYAAPATSSSTGSGLKWVSATAPEASKEKTPDLKKEPLVTPIPSVMPRYSRVRLTSGDDSNELGLDALDGLGVETPTDANTDSPMQTLAMPATDDEAMPEVGGTLTESDAQIPGAIGNEKEESMTKQGGLNPNVNALEDLNAVEPAKEQLPALETPKKLPVKDSISESFSTRQVDEKDFDMSCESSEPMHRITEITNDIEVKDGKILPKSCPLSPAGEQFPPREFPGTNFTWTASNLCHNPLYFEQPALERYGHTIGPLQPVVSGVGFLATIPALPWLMAIDPPNECQYALGYYRPGSCAPRKWSPIPYSTRAAIMTGGVATALVFLIP